MRAWTIISTRARRYNMSAHAINVEFMPLQKQLAAAHADGFIDIWTPLMKINGSVFATAAAVPPHCHCYYYCHDTIVFTTTAMIP